MRGFVYDMQNYFEKNVQTYLDVTNTPARRLGRADTPSLDESRFPLGCQADPANATAPAEQGGPTDDVPAANFNRIAAQVIMQAMYGARMARPELLRPVGKMATYLRNGQPFRIRCCFA